MTPESRPPHLRWGPIALVVIGGALGVASRETISLLVPSLGALPVAIAAVNIFGAFLLGYLYEALTRAQGPIRSAANLKLLLGTGFCGGFTTYSALATDTVLLLHDGLPALAFAYALGTIVLGACATWAGIAVATTFHSRMQSPAASRDDTGQETVA